MTFMFQQKIKGGKADSNVPSDFSKKELKKGQKVEHEHTNSKAIATEIAMDHLKEDPHYYEKLQVMEKAAFSRGFKKHRSP